MRCAVYLKPRVLIVLCSASPAGLPLALSGSTLAVWMRQSGVDLGTIGLFTLVGTPYTLKFLWAPMVDALDAPVLSRLLGRRRGWLVLSQLLLMAAIVFLAFCNPAASPWLVAFGALLVAAASATQDIVIDAFRVESLDTSEQAAGMASYVAAYRVGMLASAAGALFSWRVSSGLGYGMQGAGRSATGDGGPRAIGVATTLVAPEPRAVQHGRNDRAGGRQPPCSGSWRRRLCRVLRLPDAPHGGVDSVVRDTLQILRRVRRRDDPPFVIDLGFCAHDYAKVVKGVGLAATLVGGFAGGSCRAPCR